MINKLSEKRVIAFMKWLSAQGAEMLPTTNEYEVLRFKCQLGTGVIYKNSRGKHSVSGPLVTEALTAYFAGESWRGKAQPTKRGKIGRRKERLLKRDGDECFFCGEKLGEDMTVEHLMPVNQKGPDRIENMVLAHQKCNSLAGSMPLIEKVKLREKMRGWI
ncbi:HNH endonuclease [Microbulbifer celer]|uniref:HNH endonuclease n=1 Tax=Microbulbifer celer TaxID=435905 RepID=A0ABW3U7L7_9GAMM|nr:HNH endonuclease [Microbulbifer celer]UFN58552.1 HNH endonuclease [Microbulbifer celer]